MEYLYENKDWNETAYIIDCTKYGYWSVKIKGERSRDFKTLKNAEKFLKSQGFTPKNTFSN